MGQFRKINSLQLLYLEQVQVKSGFTVVGCDDGGIISGTKFVNGCPTSCPRSTDVIDGTCMASGCCQIPIPKGLKSFNTSMQSFKNHTKIWAFNPCGYAFLGEASRFQFRGMQDLNDINFVERIVDSVPIVLDWAIGNRTCVEA
ncbi:hypothetical protein RND71_021823 [Anisodus tanguticus]|uniref:Uncharacterized protein n=1 Tax=Anisodus tanguticus TaxID=243964 RepID=A0AAE1RVV6_9SOLA|nr:hypothetical protein RND71_021823 [Anisodus tanguticus]